MICNDYNDKDNHNQWVLLARGCGSNRCYIVLFLPDCLALGSHGQSKMQTRNLSQSWPSADWIRSKHSFVDFYRRTCAKSEIPKEGVWFQFQRQIFCPCVGWGSSRYYCSVEVLVQVHGGSSVGEEDNKHLHKSCALDFYNIQYPSTTDFDFGTKW